MRSILSVKQTRTPLDRRWSGKAKPLPIKKRMENPIPDEESGMSYKEAINQGYKLFLSATLTFGELIDEDGEMLSYDFKECFKELNQETAKDFFKRVADEVCELIEED